MYIGSTSQCGIQHLVFEAIDNAVDQFLANKVSQLAVRIVGKTIHITDDGEGYPFDITDDHGISLGVKHLTELHNTNTADNHTPHVHANGFGHGLFALNALTQRLEISAVRNGKKLCQSYSRGVPLSSVQEFEVDRPRGTFINFELDEEIFGDQSVDLELLRTKVRRLSFLFPGLSVLFQDEKFESQNGLVDLIKFEMGIESTPVFSISMHQGGTVISAAAVGNTDEKAQIASFANAVPTLDDSSHVLGLKRAFSQADWNPAGAAISVIISDPRFSGPTRQYLNMPGLEESISDLLATELRRFRAEL